MPRSDVIVIGAGAIGVAVALEAAERGASVTILERGPGVAAGCSAGNAGIVGSGHVHPLAEPAAVREGLAALGRRDGAFALALRPATIAWLSRFAWASRPSAHRAGARTLSGLAIESARLHRTLAGRLDTGFAERGFLSVFDTPARLAAAREQSDPHVRVLDGDEALEHCPQLLRTPAGALYDEREAHCDPERFVAALAEAATERGARIRTGVEVLGLRRSGRRVTTLWTTAGELKAGEVVLAAGAWSARLAADAGIALPLQGGKGYHLEYPREASDGTVPVYFPERRVVATPFGDRLRISGTMEICGTDLRVHRRRLELVGRHARELLDGVAGRPVLHTWRGLRPCTPDGLPVLGRVPTLENLTLATGHGMWGLQLAPVTGRLVGDVLAGRPDETRLWPLRPDRFSGWAARGRGRG